MINKELELTLNNEKLLERLANNLNLTYISENSTIGKISDVFKTEMKSYSDSVENSIRNGFITTMDDDLLEQFAGNFGIYRKKYNSLIFYSNEQVATLTVDQSMTFDKNYKDFIPFKKNSKVYEDSSIVITAKEDIQFSTVYDNVYPSLEININSTDPISIQEGSMMVVTSTDETVSKFIPTFYLTFNYSVGISVLEESIDDFRLRVFEHTYMSSNRANSLLHFIVKEVPALKHIEVNNIEEGRALEVIYPYTQELINTGSDSNIDSIINPLIETIINQRGVFKNLVSVTKPNPITVVAKISNTTLPTSSLLDSICLEINDLYVSNKSINLTTLKSYLSSSLNVDSIDDIKLFYRNTNLAVEDIELVEDSLQLKLGNFLFLDSIESI